MTIMWMNLAAVFMLALAARYFSVPLALPAAMHRPASPNRLIAAAAALTLVLVAGLRNNIGDTFAYAHSYRTMDFNMQTVLQSRDIGFNLFQMLLKQLSDDPQLLIFVTALLTNWTIVLVMCRYSKLLEISLYVYIASGAFTVSMNGMRQYLTAAIVFAATKFLMDGSWKRYMAVILFASLFHQSALVLIPIYFVVRRKAWTGATFALLGIAVLVVAGFNEFQDVLFAALKDTNYGHYKEFSEGGANILRVIVDAIPLFIAYLGRDKLRQLFPKSDIIVNLSIIGAVLMIIASQNWLFARMAIYFSLYQMILISWIILLFRRQDRPLVYLGILGFYFAFYFYETVITFGLVYRSDYLIW